ncbi:MAG: LamG-like jellyroll fold domain-containing protein [Verrucomicrobiales bacterium]
MKNTPELDPFPHRPVRSSWVVLIAWIVVTFNDSVAQEAFNDVAFYVPFDDSATDATGHSTIGNATFSPFVSYESAIVSDGLAIASNSGGHEAIEYRNPPSITAAGYSVAFWFAFNETRFPPNLLWQGANESGEPGWAIVVRSGIEHPYIAVQATSSLKSLERTGGTLRLKSADSYACGNRWNHIVMVFDPELRRIRCWLNGREELFYEPEVRSSAFPDIMAFRSSQPLRCASSNGPLKMDELAIWERALQPSEIANLYARGLAGKALTEPLGKLTLSSNAGANSVSLPVAASTQLDAPLVEDFAPSRSFRWWKNGVLLDHAESSVMIPLVDLNDIGTFSSVVTTAQGEVAVAETDLVVEFPSPPVIDQFVRPGRPTENDSFGASMAQRDGLLVVGAPRVNEAFVYRKTVESGSGGSSSRGNWKHLQTLSVGSDFESFGVGVATDGRTIAVADQALSMFLFEEDPASGEWRQVMEQKVRPAQNQTLRLAIDEGILVASDFEDNRAVMLERSASGIWTATANLRPPAGSGGDGSGFGFLTTVSTGTVVVSQGWPSEAQNALFIYEKRGDQWQVAQRIEPKDSLTDIGLSIALQGNRMVIGGRQRTEGFAGLGQGTAWVYERSAATGLWRETAQLWLEQAVPDVPFERFGSALGSSVALAGDRIFSFGRYDVEPVGQGDRIFGVLFDRYPNGDWYLTSRIDHPDQFGEHDSIALASENSLLVGKVNGIRLADGNPAGAVAIFQLPEVANHPSTVVGIASTPVSAQARQPITLNLVVEDAEGDVPTAALGDDAPDWLALVQVEQEITVSGTPPDRAVGTIEVGVKVTDASNVATRATITLVIDTVPESPPLIRTEPISRLATLGRAISVDADVVGTPPLQFQWEKDGSPLAEMTSATLNVTPTNSADGGVYSLVVTNAFGSVRSDLLTVEVIPVTNTLLVPTDFPGIQLAIDAAASGDTILVEPGSYTGAINFLQKDIELRSLGGPDNTILVSTEVSAIDIGPGGKVEGFTIDHFDIFGRDRPTLEIRGDGTLIDRNVFHTFEGIIIRGENASPVINGNVFSDRLVRDNGAITALGFTLDSSPLITNNVFDLTNGIGVIVHQSGESIGIASIINNTFIHSRTGVILPYPRDGREDERIVRNNIFFGSAVPIEPQLFTDERFFDFRGNLIFPVLEEASDPNVQRVMLDNFYGAPSFVSVEDHDFRLAPGSVGIGQGLSDLAPTTDLSGNPRPAADGIDLGAFEGEFDFDVPQRVGVAFIKLLNGETAATVELSRLFALTEDLVYSYETIDSDGMFSSISLDADADAVHVECSPAVSGFAEVRLRAESPDGQGIEAPVVVYRRPQATIHVPRDFAKIQDAIASVTKPTTIVLAPGIYRENHLDFDRADIALVGAGAPAETIIEAHISWIPRSNGGLAGFAEVSGVTLRSATNRSYLGIRAIERYALISDTILEGFKDSAPIDFTSSNSWRIVENCVFRGNSSSVVLAIDSTCLVANNLFHRQSRRNRHRTECFSSRPVSNHFQQYNGKHEWDSILHLSGNASEDLAEQPVHPQRIRAPRVWGDHLSMAE